MKKYRKNIVKVIVSLMTVTALLLGNAENVHALPGDWQGDACEVMDADVTFEGVEGISEEEADTVGKELKEAGAVALTMGGSTKSAAPSAGGGGMNISFQIGEEVYYGNWFTHKFYINGNLGYCLQPELIPPGEGEYVAEIIDRNPLMQKGLYYLMGGPGWTEEVRHGLFDESLNEDNIYAYCHVVLSYIYGGCNINSSAFIGLTPGEVEGLRAITEAVGRMAEPPTAEISFEGKENTTYYDEAYKVQRSKDIILKADKSNSVEIPVPDGAQLVHKGQEYTKKAVIGGGESFYMKADPGYCNGETWGSGILYGSNRDAWKALVLNASGNTQAIGGWAYAQGTVPGAEFFVKWLEKPEIVVEKTADKNDKIYKDGDIVTYTTLICQPVERAVGRNLVIKDTITKPEEGVKLQKNSIVLLNEKDENVTADVKVQGNSFTISGGDALAYTKAVSSGQSWKIEYQVKITDASKVVDTIHNEVTAKFDNSAEVKADEDITTEKEKPKIATSASDKATGKKEIVPKEEITVKDKVSYKNFQEGEVYTLAGILMEKETKEPLKINGKEIRAEKTFTADREGIVELEFTFDASSFKEKGGQIVVFEKVYDKNEVLIAAHEDINDKDQTVSFTAVKGKEPVPESNLPKTGVRTGDNQNITLWVLVSCAAIFTCAKIAFKTKKR